MQKESSVLSECTTGTHLKLAVLQIRKLFQSSSDHFIPLNFKLNMSKLFFHHQGHDTFKNENICSRGLSNRKRESKNILLKGNHSVF